MKSKILFVLFFCIALVATSFSVVSSRERNSWTYSKRSESLFKAAAYVYYNNQDVFNDKGITCMPQDVKIRYSDTHTGSYAHTFKWSAYKSRSDDAAYCSMTFDARTSRSLACVAFIHEYGHMIGRDHNKDIQSPMYDGYADYVGDKSTMLFNRWKMKILSRSVCPALRAKG